MKRILTAAATAAIILTSAIPVLADDRHDHRQGRPQQIHHAAPPQHRVAAAHRYRQGQAWHGHRLANRGGNWGYYEPRNGAQVFIQIPI